MPTYSIVSTYPLHGSRNIGDELISRSTMKAIERAKGSDVRFNVFWRAAQWEAIREGVESSDAVIFACMAIRENMAERHYPYLDDVLRSGVPVAALSAGTALDVSGGQAGLYDRISAPTIESLKRFVDSSVFFTTRGSLTQKFCDHHRLSAAVYTGDIAFYDERFDGISFSENFDVQRIAISDPHYANFYVSHLDYLVSSVVSEFPRAEICVLLHGVNPDVEDLCKSKNIKFLRIYEDAECGLDAYSDFDLHVGYRVHGHVSALKRGVPSYLLEQDGRGCDYGLTIERKVSVPAYLPGGRNTRRKWGGLLRSNISAPPFSAVEQVLAMISFDRETGFSKFSGLDDQIRKIKSDCMVQLAKLP